VPINYWKSIQHRRDFFASLESKLNIQTKSDWYKVTFKQVVEMGGATVLRHYYNSSLPKALKEVFPEHDWNFWRFKQSPKGFWKDPANVKLFIDDLKSALRITVLSEWYEVTSVEIEKIDENGSFYS
jgi:hypothetical protein